MMHASAEGCVEVARVLVDAGVDLDARNWDGDTAMQLCVRRKENPELVQVMKDVLGDGLLDTPLAWRGVEANGHFMVSILNAEDLYLEGKFGLVNTYVCLQFRARAGQTPQIAFTSCVLHNPSPQWHEVFRFDTETLDPSAVLVAWVIAAPGDTPTEVVRATSLGLTEGELQEVLKHDREDGNTADKEPPQYGVSFQDAFKRLMRREDRQEDQEVRRLRRLALAQIQGMEPTMDLQVSNDETVRDSLPLAERRWTDVDNLRDILKRSGVEVPEPLVPKSHLPLGCVVARFRQLRTAVWSADPVEIQRTLRLNSRGSLRIQVDFRPRYFAARCRMPQHSEEENDYSLKPLDSEAEAALGITTGLADDEASREAERLEEEKVALSLERAWNEASQDLHMRDPEELFKRFLQVSVWAHRVQQARGSLGPGWTPGIEAPAAKVAAQAAMIGRNKQATRTPVMRAFGQLVRKYEAAREMHHLRQMILDNPLGEDLALDTSGRKVAASSSAASSSGPPKAPQAAQLPMKLPQLKAQPWLSDILDGSRML